MKPCAGAILRFLSVVCVWWCVQVTASDDDEDEHCAASFTSYDLGFTSMTSFGRLEFAPVNQPPEGLGSCTVVCWVRTFERYRSLTILSYATTNNANEFFLRFSSVQEPDPLDNLKLTIGPVTESILKGVRVRDGKWHIISMSWSTSGDAIACFDGNCEITTGFATGYLLESGGFAVVAQDQDTILGGYDPLQSFVGELSSFNIITEALNETEHLQLAEKCHIDNGDVIRWTDFRAAIRGKVMVYSPSSICANKFFLQAEFDDD